MPGKRYAVLIGNGSFTGEEPGGAPKLPPLRCPAEDVAGLKSLLETEDHGSYLITSLIDRPHNQARRAIYDCLRKATPEDLVLIYYSGHGKLDEGGNLYLVGSDTDPESLDPTALAAADVQKYVSESRAGARIVLLDCCFSGAVGQAFLRGAAKGEVADQARQAVRGLEGKGVFYLTASADTQTAEEKDQDRYSVFTKHVIEAIREGAADADDDGQVRFSELCRFVQAQVRLEGAQRPLSFTLKADGDPVVALTGRPALAARRDAVEQEVYELCRLKMLNGGDAAQLLHRLHQPAGERVGGSASVAALIEQLHAALPDRALFLKRVHRAIEMAHEPVAPPPEPRPTVTIIPPEKAAVAKEAAAGWMSGRGAKRAAIMSAALVGTLAVGAIWAFNPFGSAAYRASSSASVRTNWPASNPPASYPAASNQPALNPPAPMKGGELVRPGAPLLSTTPNKLLAK